MDGARRRTRPSPTWPWPRTVARSKPAPSAAATAPRNTTNSCASNRCWAAMRFTEGSFETLFLLKDDDVLAGGGADSLDPGERVDGHFLFHLGLGHFVDFLDRDLGVFAAELDEDDAAPGLERAADVVHHLKRVIELVIDIDHEDEIDRGGRKFGIGDGSQDGFDVGDFYCGHLVGEQVEHFLLDFHGQ